MRTLMLSFLSLVVSSTALAAGPTLRVPGDYPTIAAAVTAARNGTTILIGRPPEVAGVPGTHVIEQQIVIDNRSLTIKADTPTVAPPREIDSSNLDAPVDVWINVPVVAASPGFEGAFLLQNGAKLTIENIRWKQPEIACSDELDNDLNGLVDGDDPYCLAQGLVSQDTGAPDVEITLYTDDARAVYARPGTTLDIKRSEFIGFGFATLGGVVRAKGAEINIEDSRFIGNRSNPAVTANGDFVEGYGGVVMADANSYVTVSNTLFAANGQKYGGALWIQDSTLYVENGCAFDSNAAEDGGAIFLESSEAQILGSFFSQNTASLVPLNRLYTTYEGGAVYSEDSSVIVKNNVFLQNSSLDVGASLMFRRAYNGNSTPLDPDVSVTIENNTFVQNFVGLEGGASIAFDQTADMRFVNNILYEEDGGALGAVGGVASWPFGIAPNVHYNLFYPMQPDEVFTGGLSGLPVNQFDNLFANPEFVYYPGGTQTHADWRIWRFWLTPTSPAVDAGDPSIYDNGDPANRSDIGAYGGTVPGTSDDDADGWPSIYDCDDGDPAVYPYAFEICNGIDDDCNGIVDDRADLYFIDADYDGYGDLNIPPMSLCPEEPPPALPPGSGTYVNQGGDCDDHATLVNPGRVEFCDGVDNDCDGKIDDNIPKRAHYIDRDNDGFGNPDPSVVIVVQCPPEGYSPFPTDCNDSNPNVHPLIDFEARSHYPLANAALERNEADRNPNFVADGVDQDCNLVDLCYADLDRDGFGQAPQPGRDVVYVEDNDLNCRNLSAFTAANDDDCDDGDPASNPKGTEVPGDGLDQDCDGRDSCYADLDDDGWGSSDVVIDDDLECDNNSSATSTRDGDCNDGPGGEEQYPSQTEVCDGVDNNCDGRIDEVTGPSAETYYVDLDGDQWGNKEEKIVACPAAGGLAPIGYAAQAGDCDDEDPYAFPDATEVCDGIDNNCINGADEATATDVVKWLQDTDGDGYGNCEAFQTQCFAPSGGAWVKYANDASCDPDDTNADIVPTSCGGCSSRGSQGAVPLVAGLLSLVLVRRRRR